MLGQLLESFEKLVTEFSWRRLFFVVALLIMVVVTVWTFEIYTGHFRIARLEQSITMLDRLAELREQKSIQNDKDLEEIYSSIKNDVKALIQADHSVPVLSRTFWKLFTGAVPWVLIAFAYVPGMRKGDTDSRNAFIGMLVLAVIFGIGGTLIPDFTMLWINYFGYPLGCLMLITLAALWWQSRKRKAV